MTQAQCVTTTHVATMNQAQGVFEGGYDGFGIATVMLVDNICCDLMVQATERAAGWDWSEELSDSWKHEHIRK